jgi:chitinase
MASAWVQAGSPPNCSHNSWGFYPSWVGTSYTPTIPFGKLTHIAHAFMGVNSDGSLNYTNFSYDPNLINLAHAAGVKVVISAGGANSASTYSPMAANAAARANFIANIAAFVSANGYDGVDIDYEFPASASDGTNLILLFQGLRTSMPEPLIISADVNYDSFNGQWWNMGVLKNSVDYFNIMIYDMFGSWTSVSGHNAALFTSTLPGAGPYGTDTGQHAITYYLGKGAPASQLQYGLAFFGMQFSTPTLYDACGGGACTGAAEIPYNTGVVPLLAGPWTYHYDASAQSPYLTANAGNACITYDNAQSIQAKASWAVNTEGLAGVFAWDITQDDDGSGNHPLLNAMAAVANCVPSPVPTPAPTQVPNPISQALPLPDPNPGAIEVMLSGPVDGLTVRIYGVAFAMESVVQTSAQVAGWAMVPLDSAFLSQVPNGLYYYQVSATRSGGGGKDVKGRLYFLR